MKTQLQSWLLLGNQLFNHNEIKVNFLTTMRLKLYSTHAGKYSLKDGRLMFLQSYISGGLAAVIYTDTLQTAIMTLGAFALVGISMSKVFI